MHVLQGSFFGPSCLHTYLKQTQILFLRGSTKELQQVSQRLFFSSTERSHSPARDQGAVLSESSRFPSHTRYRNCESVSGRSLSSPFVVDPFGDFGKLMFNSTLLRVMPISKQGRGSLSIKTNLTSLFPQAQYLGLHFIQIKRPDLKEERPDHVPKPAAPPVPCIPPGHGRRHRGLLAAE